MTKKKKKNKLLHTALAVIAAILLWIIALNETDPTMRKNFVNIAVELRGEDALAEQNLVITKYESHVDIRLLGAAKSLISTARTDLAAYVNISDITEAGTYSRSVRIDSYPYGIDGSGTVITPDKIDIVVENIITQQRQIEIETSGNLPRGIALFSTTIVGGSTMVDITGAESAVRQVKSVRATIVQENLSADETRIVELAAYDENDQVVEKVAFSIDGEAVDTVEIEILVGYAKVAEINREIEFTGNVAEGYKITSATLAPEQVKIISRDADVVGINISVALTGQETADTVVEASYVYDAEAVKIVEQDGEVPKIMVTLKIERTAGT